MSTEATISDIDVDKPPAGTECCSCRAAGHFCQAALYVNQTDLGICGPCRNGKDCEVAKRIKTVGVETVSFDDVPPPMPAGRTIPKEEWPEDTAIHETKHDLKDVPFGMRGEIRAEQRGLPKPVPINEASPPKQRPAEQTQAIVRVPHTPSVELCGCGRPVTHRGRCSSRRALGVKNPKVVKPVKLARVTTKPQEEFVYVAVTALAEMERAVAQLPAEEPLYERVLRMVEDDLATTNADIEHLKQRKLHLEALLPTVKNLIEYEDKLR